VRNRGPLASEAEAACTVANPMADHFAGNGTAPGMSARIVMEGRITSLEHAGAMVVARVDCGVTLLLYSRAPCGRWSYPRAHASAGMKTQSAFG